MILHLICIILQFDAIIITTDIYKHDGHFTEREFLCFGLGGEVGGQVGLCLVDRILYFLFGDIGFYIGIKFHHDQAVISLRGAGDLDHFGTADALQLFFDGPCHQVLDIFW
jgi:hypothetical protein